ncbi:hypothetical protein WA026_006071, partial [Henosepilachna vigintioctopunctata]
MEFVSKAYYQIGSKSATSPTPRRCPNSSGQKRNKLRQISLTNEQIKSVHSTTRRAGRKNYRGFGPVCVWNVDQRVPCWEFGHV